MRFVYGRQDMPDLLRAQEQCYLLTNGLGGYSSLSAAFSMSRGDQGLLVAARTAPNDRVALVARLSESLEVGGAAYALSTQQFADETPAEEGWKYLSSLVVEDAPRWAYDVRGVRVTREIGMAWEVNACAVQYTIENRTSTPCTLTVKPWVLGFEKGHAPLKKWDVAYENGCITTGDMRIFIQTNGALAAEKPAFALQYYMHDEPDGRPEKGLVASMCSVAVTVNAGETATLWLTFAGKADCPWDADRMLSCAGERMAALRKLSGLTDPAALQLVCAADAYVAQRASTGGKTILAGYPFFGDWGRDTMIALPGCCLSTGRYEDAKSILRTFFAYEQEGLVPNLFPEGDQEPMYNTVDAALLLINTVYLYLQKTGDMAFAKEAWPVMQRIVAHYRKGTRHGIYMDDDGLICAGRGLDQVTWMDVRVGEILPTPRHGKPVEINAYWYQDLCVMAQFARLLGKDEVLAQQWESLAQKVKKSFAEKFWNEEKGCLRDVLPAAESELTEVERKRRQAAGDQIRCNQIWAVSQKFCALSKEQRRAVTDVVFEKLYTPRGLRSLAMEDMEFRPRYMGAWKHRDLCYHQGTVWGFPLGAYFLSWLQVNENSDAAKDEVKEQLAGIEGALREGCIGQLAEVYDGENPVASEGCFAQAWSTAELLRVYEALER